LLPSGNAGVVEAVLKGEADVGLTDTDDVWAAQARGELIRAIYPAHDIEEGAKGVGTLLIPNTAAIIKGGPNPERAKQLIDFLLSAEVERMLADSVSHNLPLRESVAKDFPQFAIPDPLKTDYALAAATRRGAIAQTIRIIRDEGEEEP
jgi:iron(III) transport system substrate-binding protein